MVDNQLTVFNNAEFGEVRTVIVDDEPWFVGLDVANALGYANPRNAVPTHVDMDDRLCTQIEYAGQKRDITVINESGLYALVFGSKMPSAKKFKHWVTSEVLPSIRKTGGYNLPQTYTEALEHLLATTKEKERLELENKEMKPKAIFADAVSSSKTSILVGELAKLLKQNGVDIGQNRLFEYLRNNGYLIKSGASKNMPTQRSMDLGLFEIKENNIINPDGSVRITRTPKVTGKAQVYFINKFLEIAL